MDKVRHHSAVVLMLSVAWLIIGVGVVVWKNAFMELKDWWDHRGGENAHK